MEASDVRRSLLDVILNDFYPDTTLIVTKFHLQPSGKRAGGVGFDIFGPSHVTGMDEVPKYIFKNSNSSTPESLNRLL